MKVRTYFLSNPSRGWALNKVPSPEQTRRMPLFTNKRSGPSVDIWSLFPYGGMGILAAACREVPKGTKTASKTPSQIIRQAPRPISFGAG